MTITERVQATLEFLRIRSRDYKLAFSSPIAQNMLIDLAKFCRANETCFHPDPRMHAILEGRREVWLRIQHHINLTPDELLTLYSGRNFQTKPGENK